MNEKKYTAQIEFCNPRAVEIFETIAESLAFAFDHGPAFGSVVLSVALHKGRVLRQSVETVKQYRYNGSASEDSRDPEAVTE